MTIVCKEVMTGSILYPGDLVQIPRIGKFLIDNIDYPITLHGCKGRVHLSGYPAPVWVGVLGAEWVDLDSGATSSHPYVSF